MEVAAVGTAAAAVAIILYCALHQLIGPLTSRDLHASTITLLANSSTLYVSAGRTDYTKVVNPGSTDMSRDRDRE